MEPDKLTDLEDKAWMREALKLADWLRRKVRYR